ncbi:MAG: hypothetical protein CMQ24_21960 [Gammaproteobacteria bacterium]|nr:hypothetical protein [Gammaproteobacteria bacterium]
MARWKGVSVMSWADCGYTPNVPIPSGACTGAGAGGVGGTPSTLQRSRCLRYAARHVIGSGVGMGEFMRVERGEGWGEIVLNRPERRNSLIPPLAGEVTQALDELQADHDVQSILLRGEGGYFCSGIDLKALQADPPPDWKGKQVGDVRTMHLALFSCTKPVIGAFEKFGINAGAALAFACDILVAGETAFLQIGEIQQGANIPMNAAWLKIKTTEQVAARLALYGDRVPGPELLRLGIATEVVADDQVVTRCREVAARIAGFPKGAGANIVQSLRAQRGIDDPEAFFPKGGNNALLTAAQLRS